jgi:hypothetical protein
MKIAIISTNGGAPLTGKARDFLPTLAAGLAEKGNEVHLFTDAADASANLAETKDSEGILKMHSVPAETAAEETAADLTLRLNALDPDVYLIWSASDAGWMVLPFLNSQIATLAIGHADAEAYYAPARHYRAFLTRVIATTPEIAVGFVLACVIDKERVEWISFDEGAASEAENERELIETYCACFEKAIADVRAVPRPNTAAFPPLKTGSPEQGSWFERLKSKIMK